MDSRDLQWRLNRQGFFVSCSSQGWALQGCHGAMMPPGLRVFASFCFTILSIEAFLTLFSFSQHSFFMSRHHCFVPARKRGKGPEVAAKAFSWWGFSFLFRKWGTLSSTRGLCLYFIALSWVTWLSLAAGTLGDQELSFLASLVRRQRKRWWEWVCISQSTQYLPSLGQHYFGVDTNFRVLCRVINCPFLPGTEKFGMQGFQDYSLDSPRKARVVVTLVLPYSLWSKNVEVSYLLRMKPPCLGLQRLKGSLII